MHNSEYFHFFFFFPPKNFIFANDTIHPSSFQNGVSDDLVSQAVHDTNSKDHFGTSAPPPSAVRVANAIASVWKDATFRWDGTPLIHTHSLFGLRAILERDKIVVVDAEERKKYDGLMMGKDFIRGKVETLGFYFYLSVLYFILFYFVLFARLLFIENYFKSIFL